MPSQVDLSHAIDRALCTSPKTHAAWANIKAAAAVVGESAAAYLPTITGTLGYSREHVTTDVRDSPTLNSNFNEGVTQTTASLEWLLLDFGVRSATLENSRALLEAVNANQNLVFQTVIATVAKDYFASSVAEANVESTLNIESAAGRTLEAASARVERGVAPVTDRLQADTAYAKATYERAKAENDLRSALGTLAIDMDMSPAASTHLVSSNSAPVVDSQYVKAVGDLLEYAVERNPTVVAAEAQWRAALAKTRETRAAGMPTLSVVGQLSYSNQPVSASLGQEQQPATTRDNYIGLKISVPLFEGFSRGYQIHQAQADADAQEQAVRDAKQRVAATVWSNYQTLHSTTDNVKNTEVVVGRAREAFAAVQQRYQAGVGSILEVLNAQNIFAEAEQLRIQAQYDWRNATIQLALSVGNLGLTNVE